jgi:hypothetical protein
MVFIKAGLVVGGSIGRMEVRSCYPPPRSHHNKTFKKCDETVKNHAGMVAGPFFGWQKWGCGCAVKQKSESFGPTG